MPPRVNPRVPAEGAQAPDIAAILANLANSMADMATQCWSISNLDILQGNTGVCSQFWSARFR